MTPVSSQCEDATTDVPQRILNILASNDEELSSLHLADKLNVDHQKIVGALKSLLSHTDVSTQISWYSFVIHDNIGESKCERHGLVQSKVG